MLERVRRAAQEKNWIWGNSAMSGNIDRGIKEYEALEEKIREGLATGQFTLQSRLVPKEITMVS